MECAQGRIESAKLLLAEYGWPTTPTTSTRRTAWSANVSSVRAFVRAAHEAGRIPAESGPGARAIKRQPADEVELMEFSHAEMKRLA